MQYGADIKSFTKSKQRKIKEESVFSSEDNYSRLIIIALASFLISRVYIDVNLEFIKTIAPFGIVFIISIANLSIKEGIIALASSIIGYVTLIPTIEEIPIFIIMSILMILTTVILGKNNKISIVLNFILSFVLITGYGILILKKDLIASSVVGGIITGILIPTYYIISYGIKCLNEFKTQHYFDNDEIISIELLLSIIIVGIGNISIFNLDIRNIIAIFFVLFISYIGKGNLGATVGLILGAVFGMITGNITFYIAVFGVSCLISTIFRESGRFLSYISFNTMYILLAFYLKSFDMNMLIELFIGSTVFILIPKKVIEKIRIEFDDESKKDEFNEKHFNKMKNELSGRLSDFTDVLNTMGTTLNTMVENEKLVDKNKAEALVDNLADRVCKNCDYKKICWKREMHETYSSFKELIQSYEEGENQFPLHLKKKCLKEGALIAQTQELVNKHIADEMLKKRLGEGRRLLSSHIKNMSATIGEIVNDFSGEVNLAIDIERIIRKALLKNNIEIKDIIAYTDKESRLNIKIDMENCEGLQYCVKDILPIVNKTIGRTMSIAEECHIDPSTSCCEILIEEAPRYHVNSHVSLCSKDGEKYTGDSYSFGKTKDGHHMILLCDGMGTGPRAGAESRIAVEMVEKFSEVGFSEKTAIDTINSIMSIKFSEEEKFSTLDMQKINLYDGRAKFLKVGAMESFVKRGNKVKIIDSKTLPFGVLDTPDIDEFDLQLKGGDFIITISDGVLDLFKDGDLSNTWLVNLLEKTRARTSKELSSEILSAAKEITDGKAKDDMTVVVSKIYNLQ